MWNKGYITPTWDCSFKKLNYINRPFNDNKTLFNWKKLGHEYKNYTGEMIDVQNKDLPNWCLSLSTSFNLINPGVILYKMSPGCILPNHSDTFKKYRKIHNLNSENTNIWRIVVFLEDWQSGHYFEIDNTPITNWKAGDYVKWKYNVPHIAANIGSVNRFTLQITGSSDVAEHNTNT